MAKKQLIDMSIPELREECRSRGMAAEETAGKQDLITRCLLFDSNVKVADMPEPGYKRDEEMARRKDDLEERAEKMADEQEVYAADPAAFTPDRDILSKLDQRMLAVSEKQAGYQYCWAYFGQNGQQVWAKRALGWEVVSGPMPEAKEHKVEDGTRRIGDVLLMRCKMERFMELEKAAADAREAQELGITSTIRSLGERARRYGIKIHEDLSQVRVGPDTLMDVVEKRAGAYDVAEKQVDKMLRQGKVPGMPAPGGR
jgi:hypothetical protein